MPPFKIRQKSPRTYAEQAAYLRKLGFGVTLKGNRKQSPQQRSAVTRLYNDVSGYTEDNRFKFVRLAKDKRKQLKGVFSSNTLTPRGVFIQVPKGINREDYKLSVSKKKGVRIQGKNIRDIYLTLDPEKLAVDPGEAFKDVLANRRPIAVKLVVNGHESPTKKSKGKHFEYDLKQFYQYFDQLHKAITTESGENSESIKRNQKRAYSDEEFADIFHLKLIYK